MPAFSPSRIELILSKITNLFERNKIDYFLIGAMALSVWGKPRTTLDLDFMIMIPSSDLKKISSLLGKEGFKVDRKWVKWNPLIRDVQLRLNYEKVAVDLLLPRDPHDEVAFQKKKRKKMGKKSCWVVSPEDFILQKLKVGRPHDFEDVLTVLARSRGKLNISYLKKWSKKLGIVAEVNYILAQ